MAYRKRPPTSGYTRTDIIGNYDLYPDEGYEFPRRDTPKITPTQKDSSMFPLNKKINDKVKMGRVEEELPQQVTDPYMTQVKSFRSKRIFEQTISTRTKQIAYSEQKKQYDLAVKAVEAEQEMKQVELAKQKQIKDRMKREKQMSELRNVYKQQLADVEKRKQREKQEELEYEAELRRLDAIKDAEEEQRLAKQRQIARERREEFDLKNQEILMRKAKKIEEDLEYERRIAKENAEIEARRDARAAEDERRRFVKTQMRSRVVEQRAKALEREMKKNEDVQQAAESAAAKATMQEVMTLREKQDQMRNDRHKEWLLLQKEKTARMKHGTKQPFPVKRKDVDEEEFGNMQRKRDEERIKRYQRRQIDERTAREKKEIQDDIDLDQKMIQATQANFDRSLQTLQTLIPSELGITVPTYTLSGKSTKLV